MRNFRYIEICQNTDDLLGGPEVHVIKFHAGKSCKEVVLTTRELKELKLKIGNYINTYNIGEPKQLSLWPNEV